MTERIEEKKEEECHEVGYGDLAAYAWQYLRHRKRGLAIVGTASLVSIACDVMIPVFSGRIIDALSGEIPGGVGAAATALMIFAGLALAHNVIKISAMYEWAAVSIGVMRDMVGDTTRRVQRFSSDWQNNSFAGATVRKITRGMWAYDALADTMYFGLIPAALVTLGICGLMFAHWPVMGAVLLCGIVVYAAVSITLSLKYNMPAFQLANRQDTRLGATLADTVSCNAVVKAFGSERREDERLAGVTSDWRRLTLRGWNRMTNTDLVQSLVLWTLVTSVVSLAVWLWQQGRATPGEVVYAMTSTFMLSGYMREIGRHVRHMQKGLSDIEDMILFNRRALGVEDRPDAGALQVRRGEITLERVRFGYENQGTPVYRDFSLHIRPGEKIGLVGHSGSGKSTFIKLLQRLYDVQGGRILVDGQDISAVTQESLRQSVALVPQDPVLFHRSLAENIAYGKPEASRDEIVRAARLAHAHEFIRGLPEGYDTLVGERGVKLSGGERQRVAIARAILADAPILVLDEATSSLDSISESLIQEALERLMDGRTTLVVAHRLSTIQQVDRILVFDHGQVVEQGSHAELVTSKGPYRELFDAQAFGLVGAGELAAAG